MVVFSGPKLRNGIAGSCDTSVLSVSRNLRAVFLRGLTIYIPTKTMWSDFIFCAFSAVLFLEIFLRSCHSGKCEVMLALFGIFPTDLPRTFLRAGVINSPLGLVTVMSPLASVLRCIY